MDLLNLHDSSEEIFESLNSYLKVAYLSLSIANRPLHSKDILILAERFNLFPEHLSGVTPEKTLNARLSEHILNENDSVFYRTAPATYYLSHLTPVDELENSYEALKHIRRTKIIKDEKVLVAPSDELKKRISGKFVQYKDKLFQDTLNDICFFMNRITAEKDTTVKQFVTYTVVHRENKYAVYRRGKYSNPSQNLQNTLSIAFGGHVSASDFDLFNRGAEALINNSSRELYEELSVSHIYESIDEINARSSLLGFINVDDNSDAKQHIAVLVSVEHASDEVLLRGELGIADLSWFTKSDLLEHKPYFDLWSRIVVDRIVGNSNV